jgi:hypothetical protein
VRSESLSTLRGERFVLVSCFCTAVSLGWRSCLGSDGSVPEAELLPRELSLLDELTRLLSPCPFAMPVADSTKASSPARSNERKL